MNGNLVVFSSELRLGFFWVCFSLLLKLTQSSVYILETAVAGFISCTG